MKEKLKEYSRILRVAKKPSLYEFKTLLKITGLGLLIIGAIGFVIKVGARIVK